MTPSKTSRTHSPKGSGVRAIREILAFAMVFFAGCTGPSTHDQPVMRSMYGSRLNAGDFESVKTRLGQLVRDHQGDLEKQAVTRLLVFGKEYLLFVHLERKGGGDTLNLIATFPWLKDPALTGLGGSETPWQPMERVFLFEQPSLPKGGSNVTQAPTTLLRDSFETAYLSNHAHPPAALLTSMSNQGMEHFAIYKRGSNMVALFDQRRGLELPKAPFTEEDRAVLSNWSAFAEKALLSPFPGRKGVWQNTEWVVRWR